MNTKLILAVVVAAAALYWFVIRKKSTSAAAVGQSKIDAPTTVIKTTEDTAPTTVIKTTEDTTEVFTSPCDASPLYKHIAETRPPLSGSKICSGHASTKFNNQTWGKKEHNEECVRAGGVVQGWSCNFGPSMCSSVDGVLASTPTAPSSTCGGRVAWVLNAAVNGTAAQKTRYPYATKAKARAFLETEFAQCKYNGCI